jgi:mannose-6-phosphate isomerase-like protein (cupin superfamily)
MSHYLANIEEETLGNDNFRKVIFTGAKSQLVLMSLLPGEDIGDETHMGVDQFFRIEDGSGKVIIDGQEYPIWSDFAFVITAGTKHNVVNTGDTPLKLYTIYSPANHIEDRVHKTKADALADTLDEEFGHKNH